MPLARRNCYAFRELKGILVRSDKERGGHERVNRSKKGWAPDRRISTRQTVVNLIAYKCFRG